MECNRLTSRLLSNSSSLKEESSSSVDPLSSPRALSLASRSWISNSVFLLPMDAYAGPIMLAIGSWLAVCVCVCVCGCVCVCVCGVSEI